MKEFDKKLREFEQSNPLSLFYEFGFSPDDVKNHILHVFNEYFQNKKKLEESAIRDLVSSWLLYLTIQRDYPESVDFIQIILDIFNGAKSVDEEETIKAYTSWFPELNQSISRFWSLYNVQYNINELCVEDFLEEALRGIGQSIEGLSKPFLKLLLHLNRIKRNKPVVFSDILSKDLGWVIDELISSSDLNRLLIFEPNSVRLNQWRNIAYHHNTKVVSGEIICSLKRNGTVEEFPISRTELFDTLKRTVLIYKLIRIAETIFCLDNLIQIRQSFSNSSDPQLNYRQEGRLLDFYAPISSQGFAIKNLKYDQNLASMDICDMDEYSDFIKRAIHSSQFLYNLWLFTQSSKLEINYFLYSGEKYFTSEIYASSILKVSDKAGISELLKDVNFLFISQEYRQDKNPFENLTFSTEIIEQPQKFSSQLGEPISLEEFTKQFSLSVFCNYLITKSEGFEGIKINIGSDGSLTVTEKPQSILLQVPAIIKNKALQTKLIEVLNQLIELYEKKELKYDIVLQAKNANRFFQKKALIKEQLKIS